MPTRLHRAALAAALLTLPGLAHAQTMLVPGHPDLAAPAPQSYTYEVRIAGATPRRLGSVTRTETLADGRLTIVNHLVIPARNQDQTDTTVVAWPGMAPVSRATHNGEAHVRVAFAGGRLTGRNHLGNLDEALDAAVPAGAFAEGVSSTVARAVPLRAGYAAAFRMVDATGYADTSRVSVGEQAGGAWPVTVTIPGDQAITYAVDGATREIRRFAFSPQPGMTVETAPAAAAPVGAVLRPGDAALNTAWMATGETATYTLQLVEPMAMDVGTAATTRTVAGGVVTTTQTITVPSQNMTETQTARADLATLAPLGHASTGRSATELAFTPTAVSGTKDGAAVAVALDAPVFDSTWQTEIAQSLPLAEGYTATAAIYDATNGLGTVSFAVRAQETLDGAAVWPVDVVSPNGPTTVYVDAATRAVAKMRMSPQEGVIVEMVRQP